MIRIREIGKLDSEFCTVMGDSFRLYVRGEKVHEAPIETSRRITHWACIEIGQSGLAYVIGDETLEADLKKLAAVQWTDRDLIQGVFDRMPGYGPQKLGL
jgi:hypothetical protein